MIARVAVYNALERLFDYTIPATLLAHVRPGVRVWVPWRTGAMEGVVWEVVSPETNLRALKSLGQLVDGPALDEERMALARWIADYYLAPPGEVARLFLPVGGISRARDRARLSKEGKRLARLLAQMLESPELAVFDKGQRALLAMLRKGPRLVDRLQAGSARVSRDLEALQQAGLVEIEARVVTGGRREDDGGDGIIVDSVAPPELNPAQHAAVTALVSALDKGEYAPFLLHGVTGSGKTEVYLRVIEAAIARGKKAMVLVPEIALTPQLTDRFEARFGRAVAVLHSALSDRDRQIAWNRLERGEAAIALGARSAVFAPQPGLGIVVVDEEHDSSFKQDDGVRYHGRDAALRRARSAQGVAILGSATPSLETFAAAQEGRLRLLSMPDRAAAAAMPPVEVFDLRVHKPGPGGFLAAPLAEALQRNLLAGEQSILFLNRRGFSTFVLCKTCGLPHRCPDCAVSLTYHRADDELVCHYCGFRTAPPKRCGTCGSESLERLGYGTEQVQSVIEAHYPTARVARLDRDTAEGDGLVTLLDAVRAREVDIIVGTQMIAKGHDFPSVTLVGVVLADHGMGLPDFRASERTFQLLAQVAGRAGRGALPGRVIVQTYNPKHPAIEHARTHDYLGFFASEIEARRETGYPPALRFACVRIDGADAGVVKATAERAVLAARALAEKAPADEQVEILGPAEAPLSRLKGRSRWQLFVKAKSPHVLRRLATEAKNGAQRVTGPRGVRVSIDIDPASTL